MKLCCPLRSVCLIKNIKTTIPTPHARYPYLQSKVSYKADFAFCLFKQVILYFWGFCASFIVLCSIFVHVKVQRQLLAPTENTAALPETPGLELSLYFCNLYASLCNRCYVIIHFWIFIIKYVHSSQSLAIQSLLLQRRYFRSHYLARQDPPFSCLYRMQPINKAMLL